MVSGYTTTKLYRLILMRLCYNFIIWQHEIVCWFLCFACDVNTLIEILWSNFPLEKNSSWIWLSAGTPLLVLSRPEYSEVALEYRQKVKSRNYFAQVSDSTTKFLSVYNRNILNSLKTVFLLHLRQPLFAENAAEICSVQPRF